MDFSGYSVLAIAIASFLGFAFGAVYYGVLSKPWMKAAGIAPENAKMAPSLLAIGFFCEIVMAIMLAGIIGHLGEGQATLRNGIISALFIWVGFVISPMIVNHRYGGKGWDLTLIDGAHWLGVLVIMGAVIGYFGV